MKIIPTQIVTEGNRDKTADQGTLRILFLIIRDATTTTSSTTTSFLTFVHTFTFSDVYYLHNISYRLLNLTNWNF